MNRDEIQKVFGRMFRRREDSNKYDYGHVLIVGGSPGMVGAPLLAGQAALRVGAGLVTIASSQEVTNKLERRVEEIMTLALPRGTSQALAAITKFMKERRVTAAVIGPGLGAAEAALARGVVQAIKLPVVLDAGGATAFRDHLDLMSKAGSNNPGIIITPHTGEYEKLTGTKLTAAAGQPKDTAAGFAKSSAVTVVLKGHHTLVVSPGGRIYENQTGNPGLATAGTGDVLSGVIAGLLAQNISSFEACQAGVYIHGLAGDLAAKAKTEPGIIASDVIDSIPAALKEIQTVG